MPVVTFTKTGWKLGEKYEIPYPMEIKDLESIKIYEGEGDGWVYTKESAWHKYEKGKGIYIKLATIEELKDLAGEHWTSLYNILTIERPSPKTIDYDNYNEYASEPTYDREQMWEEMSEEGIYED